jgi:hypothetical protein
MHAIMQSPKAQRKQPKNEEHQGTICFCLLDLLANSVASLGSSSPHGPTNIDQRTVLSLPSNAKYGQGTGSFGGRLARALAASSSKEAILFSMSALRVRFKLWICTSSLLPDLQKTSEWNNWAAKRSTGDKLSHTQNS